MANINQRQKYCRRDVSSIYSDDFNHYKMSKLKNAQKKGRIKWYNKYKQRIMNTKNIIDEFNINKYIECLYNEEWRRIKEFPNYLISNYGRCYSLNQYRLLKPQTNEYKTNTPYYGYRLTNSIKTCWKKTHRLVAEAFIDNPKNKPEVHHINDNPWDNRADNLQWVTEDEHDEIHRMIREAEKLYKKNRKTA